MSLDYAVFAVYGNSWKVADSLRCSCELVEEGSFAGVLVARERKSQGSTFGQRFGLTLNVIPAFLTESGVLDCVGLVKGTDEAFGGLCVLYGADGDVLCVCGA